MKRPSTGALSLIAWLLAAPALALAPFKSLQKYGHDVWKAEDGLPHNSIESIAQTPDGYLWLGTDVGLVRFDGVQFTTFNRDTVDLMKANRVNLVRVARDGALWAGTEGGGLLRLADGHFTNFTTKDGLSNDIVRAFFEDRDGAIWIGTYNGLSRKDARGWTTLGVRDGIRYSDVRAVYRDRSGTLWISSGLNGFDRLVDGRIVPFAASNAAPRSRVTCLVEDGQGRLWVGTWGEGLLRWENDRFVRVAGTSSAIITALHEDRDHNLWVGTEGGGLDRIRGETIASFLPQNGLTSNSVKCLFEDREGSLWIGTKGGGLNRLKDEHVTAYTTKDGLSDDVTWSVTQDHTGAFWIGTERGGLDRLKDGVFTSFGSDRSWPTRFVKSVHEDPQGRLWIGLHAGGIGWLDHGRFHDETGRGLSHRSVRAIYTDHSGSLWVGTAKGLNRLQDGRFTVYTTRDGLPSDDIRVILEDHAGNLWIAPYNGGLTRLRDGQFKTYGASDGLSSRTVRALYEDAQGTLWIGLRGGGLNRFRDGRFVIYTTKEGLFDNDVNAILEDDPGNMWMSCRRGVFRVRKDELEAFAHGRLARINSVAYGLADGMKSTECAGGIQPSGWKARDGSLWFPTSGGLIQVDPRRINDLAPPVVIEEVVFDRQKFDPRQDVRLPHGTNNLEVHYTGLSLLASKKILFRYKLDGYDHGWIDAGARRVAYYTNLPSGRYEFHVRASNNEGVWNESGATFSFTLAPPFYRTAWFYGFCVALLAVVGHHLYRLRLRRLEVRERHLAERVEQSTNDLRQQIAERESTEKSLQESEERYRRLVELSPDAIAVDHKGHIVYVNQAGLRLLGARTAEQVLGRATLDFIAPEVRESVRERARNIQEERAAVPLPEQKIVRLQGVPVDVDIIAIPFTYRNEPAVQLVVRDITERKQAEAQIRSLAYHDPLTGLPNRLLFSDRLSIAVAYAHRQQLKMAVLFLDLDRFKVINDSLGHNFGDQLLSAVADRLRASVREGDTVARLGGDEFTLLLPDVNRPQSAARVAEKILESLRQPFRLEGRELFVTASMGISFYPEDGGDAETLLKNADIAMYRAKDQGRDNFQHYTPMMNARAFERFAMENSLRRAVANDELVVHYQPLVELMTGQVHAVEALLRWRHPEKGLVWPADFIPLAEVTGLILAIGPWIQRTAALQVRAWQDRFGVPLGLSINLSARQFQQSDLAEQVKKTLLETGLPGWCLDLEITESDAMQNADMTIHTLRELKALGVRVSIDDFGIGYSSLSYLKRLPIDTLKIDQSFVRDITTDADDAAIVTAVIAMAHTLKLQVVAEGVETEEQLAFLAAHRCDLMQGYLFSHPIPAEECERLLARHLRAPVTRTAGPIGTKS